jgi:hypothetical protein
MDAPPLLGLSSFIRSRSSCRERRRPWPQVIDPPQDDQMNDVDPSMPFFLHYIPGATHAPHHPTPEWIKKISDMHLFGEEKVPGKKRCLGRKGAWEEKVPGKKRCLGRKGAWKKGAWNLMSGLEPYEWSANGRAFERRCRGSVRRSGELWRRPGDCLLRALGRAIFWSRRQRSQHV